MPSLTLNQHPTTIAITFAWQRFRHSATVLQDPLPLLRWLDEPQPFFFRRAPGSWRFILQWTWWTSESMSSEIMAHRPFFSVGLLNFSVLREKCIKIPLQILTCLVLPGLMTGLALGLAKNYVFSSICTYIWSQLVTNEGGKAKA